MTIGAKWGKIITRSVAAIATAGAAGALMEVDIFDQQDLRAYVKVTYHCVLKAVDNLMKDLGQDPSRIERKSKGFLEVW